MSSRVRINEEKYLNKRKTPKHLEEMCSFNIQDEHDLQSVLIGNERRKKFSYAGSLDTCLTANRKVIFKKSKLTDCNNYINYKNYKN